MSDLKGKVAVVLGASGKSNFGYAIAKRLAGAGASVVVAARRLEPLKQLAEEIDGMAVACDVTDEGQIEALFTAAVERYGRVDIAINSAGALVPGMIAALTAEHLRPTLEISFIAPLLFFKHAAAAMQDGGSVMTISSLTARLPFEGLAAYAGARAGIDYALKIAAVEYREKKVRFNSIAAGLIHTDMTDALFGVPEVLEAHLKFTGAGRMGTLDDMAEAALWLADEKASGFVNGQIIDLSGGQQLGWMPR